MPANPPFQNPPPMPADDEGTSSVFDEVDDTDADPGEKSMDLVEDDFVPGSTESAGQKTDEGKGRIFPCEGCGADLKFHIGQQQLKCPYCGFEKEIELSEENLIVEQDFHATLARLRDFRERKDEHSETARNEVRCESCGGNVEFIGSLTSSECPYCASPIQLEDVHKAEHRIPVDAVLPFLVDKKTAKTNLIAWVKSRWFAPNDFLKKGADGKFSGVYLPYWTYDSLTYTRYRGERGEYYYVTVGTGKNKRRQRRTRWYPAAGNFERFFDDVLVQATQKVNRKMVRKLEPWPLHKSIPFKQEVLAGYLARTYEIELDDGFHVAKERIDDQLERDVRRRIGGDTQRVHKIQTRYNAITFKHLLLPLWLLAYRYNNKVYQVMINAATGEVQGDRPYSWVKITLAVLGGLLLAGGIALLAGLAQGS